MKRTTTPHCAYCKQIFVPALPGAKVCGVECAEAIAIKKRQKVEAYQAKEQRKETRAKLDAIKTLPQLKKEAQRAFNFYIRMRDAELPCICCGRFASEIYSRGGQWDAGHYRSVGSAPHLRFNEINVNKQLKQCNSYGAGRAVDYRIGLIAKHGLEAVEALESDNGPRRYTKDDLRQIKRLYEQKAKSIAGGNEK